MQCRSCGADNSAGATRCKRCQVRLVETGPYLNSSAVPRLAEYEEAPAPKTIPFEVHATPATERTPVQGQLFVHTPMAKVVTLPRQNTKATQARPQTAVRPTTTKAVTKALAKAASAAVSAPLFDTEEVGFVELKSPQVRRKSDDTQAGFAFPPPPAAHRPFHNLLTPVGDVVSAPIVLRWWSLVIDAAVVAMLSVTAIAGMALGCRIFHDTLAWDDITAMPMWMLALLPVVISLGYKAIWAVCESPTIGLQHFGLDVRAIDGSRPTVGQRLIRPFAGWIKFASVVGMLWPIVTQERYSMQDLVSQTVVTYRPGYGPDDR